MKEKHIRGIILLLVFIAAVSVFSMMTNKGNTDMTADMDSATLPTISFETAGRQVNLLNGHKKEMNLTAMRDVITPLDANGQVLVNIQEYDQKIKELRYEVYTLDGLQCLLDGNGNTIEEGKVWISVGDVLNGEEGVLRIKLLTEEDLSIYFYTRIIMGTDLNITGCLDYVELLHNAMIQGGNDDALKYALESNEKGDNTTLQHVTIHSNLEHVKWGTLNPEVFSEVQYHIQETKKAYTAVELNYRVKCVGDNNEEEYYDVDEYFQVCIVDGKKYLLNYDRTIQEVFDGSKEVLTSKGINMGLISADMCYKSNQDGTAVAFVQNRELWCYNQVEDEFALVFSFADSEKDDIRNMFDSHEIKILSMGTDGSLTFAVYGYMNRGVHEGESGLAIYYYNLPQNVVEEIAFIPSVQSEMMIEEELGKMAYYNHDLNILYVMLSGTLQKIYLETEETEILLEDLKEEQYVSSDDGRLLAYQANNEANEVVVLDFSNDTEKRIAADKGAMILPLGFVYEDFVYGMARAEDVGKTASGEEVQAMYRLEIRDDENQIVKTYEIADTFITDVKIQDNMITLERALKGQEIYTVVSEDYITNNEETSSAIELKSYWTDLKETQYRLVFEDGISNKKANVLKPKHVLFERNTTINFESELNMQRYAVYGYGDLLGLYEEAGEAIQHAIEVSGIVISPEQNYVWEDGNRVAWYRNFEMPRFAAKSGETTLAASVRAVASYAGYEIDAVSELQNKSVEEVLAVCGEGLRLKGCSSADVRYLIDKAIPVIALTGSNEAVVLVGYDAVSVTYIEPQNGAVRMKSFEAMDQMMKSGGNTFFAYRN